MVQRGLCYQRIQARPGDQGVPDLPEVQGLHGCQGGQGGLSDQLCQALQHLQPRHLLLLAQVLLEGPLVLVDLSHQLLLVVHYLQHLLGSQLGLLCLTLLAHQAVLGFQASLNHQPLPEVLCLLLLQQVQGVPGPQLVLVLQHPLGLLGYQQSPRGQ